MKKIGVILSIVSLMFTNIWCRKAQPFPEENYDPRLSGGSATVFLANAKAFGSAIDGLNSYDAFMHSTGDLLFNQTFVSAPAPLYGGLGPIYNNVSCVSCHHNDGKGTPTLGNITSSLLTRISIPGADINNDAIGIPGFGTQLQDKAIAGKMAEAKVSITYSEATYTFPDGEVALLRTPQYTFNNAYEALPSAYSVSVRLAPPVFGLGLLALIPETTLLQFADPNDADGDGISGRANYVYHPLLKKLMIGRFGLKANTADLYTQVAAAYHQDMGITTTAFSRESSWGQLQYDDRSDDPELADSLLQATVFYVQTLAVPARRNVTDETVKRGAQIFNQLQCNACHKSNIITGVDIRLPVLSNQRIHPYTDLLLHDMGAGLADNRTDFLATGTEWRTPSLWGIGLLTKVNGTAFYLHDGRARTVTEAILWHGGEAEKAKNNFTQLSKSDREALLKFIQSL
jgi:CxxC motif-containing protein (DUF1111 family)